MKLFSLLLIGSLFISNAFAHSGLKSSVPEDKSVFNEAPKVLTLTFKKPVRLVKLTVNDQTDAKFPIGFTFSPKSQSEYQYTLPPLTNGIYKVTWVMMGKDSHKVKGNFSFTLDQKITKVDN